MASIALNKFRILATFELSYELFSLEIFRYKVLRQLLCFDSVDGLDGVGK